MILDLLHSLQATSTEKPIFPYSPKNSMPLMSYFSIETFLKEYP